MEIILPLITENAEAIATALFALIGHFAVKFYVMFSNTKDTWWYKVLEAIALVFYKVKDKAGAKVRAEREEEE